MENNRNLSGTKVLIVEDSITQAMQLKQSLEENQFRVTTATDGVNAVENLKEDFPDIIISDINMSPMDGYDFCRYIKTHEKFKNIPFIILTTLSETTDVIKGIECGADGFMTKPYDLQLLLSNISDVLGNKKIMTVSGEVRQITLFLSGQEYRLTINQTQIISLLLSTYSNAIYKNLELEKTHRKLNISLLELAKKNNELEKLNQEKNQFLGMAAHDLRNPLGAISSYSTLLLEHLKEQISKEDYRMLENIKRSSTFMLDLINDLLSISVIESGKVNLNITNVNIVELTKEILEYQETIAAKKQITILSRFQEPIPEIRCDRDKINQVLTNIIGNAVKYSNPGKQIDISVAYKESEKTIDIRVKDRGIGIMEKELQSIFQAFIKCKTKGTAGESSTGLGLAIVKKIVEAHHGTIAVESEVGIGSTFIIKLPVSQ